MDMSEAKTESRHAESEVTSLPSRKRRPFAILAAVGALVVLIICGYLFLTAGEEDTDDAQVTADLVPVGTRVPGQVLRVLVKENQLVKKGELLAEIDPADYQARVEQAEAELLTAEAQAQAADAQVQVTEAGSKGGLTSARAALTGSSVGVGSADAQVQVARAGLQRAETDIRRTQTDLERARSLRAANAVPQASLDNAQANFDAALAQLQQAKAMVAAAEEGKQLAVERVSEARGRLGQATPIEAQIAAARAQATLAHARVQSAQAGLELAKLQLSYTKITAPADGLASKLTAHEGQLLQMGQPIINLVPTATYVIANFKETQVGKMRPGQTARIKIDAFPGRTFEGKVESLSGGTGSSFSLLPPDNASGNFVKVVQRVPVHISWQSVPSDVVLRAGLSADVTVEVGR